MRHHVHAVARGARSSADPEAFGGLAAGVGGAGVQYAPDSDPCRSVEVLLQIVALPAYAPLGDAGCERLAELASPFGRAVVDAGLLKLG
ncbi:hypothetical protein [Streptomyces sp. enrichment culture]|uniref:hypothetical protein n=1 Tax=Streptomyces sp. enrichment culture TaxID=1795815 RepID=UPI003F544879